MREFQERRYKLLEAHEQFDKLIKSLQNFAIDYDSEEAHRTAQRMRKAMFHYEDWNNYCKMVTVSAELSNGLPNKMEA